MSIQISCDRKKFLIHSENMSYGIGISDEFGFPVNLHWGARITSPEEMLPPEEISYLDNVCETACYRRKFTRLEYPVYTGESLSEPCLKLSFPPELEDLRLKYRSCSTPEPDHLILELKEAEERLSVFLHYRVKPEFDLLFRRVEIRNDSQEKIRLENFYSASWNLPRCRPWRMTRLYGGWGGEFRVERTELPHGETVIQSRIGSSGHRSVPFFAMDSGTATEQSGEVYFGTVLWNGNWKILAELDEFGELRIGGGWNDFDFSYELLPRERLESPEFIGGFTNRGFGGMSRAIHRWHRREWFPENMRNALMPAVYNTFAALRHHELNERNVAALIPPAARIGLEAFLIDDGWQKANGDWFPHPERFPNGLKPLSAAAKALGMKFGLWIEMERADRNSEIAKQHPEWLIDERDYSLLDLSRTDVRDHLYRTLKRIITDYDLDYVKVDFNRYPGIPRGENRRERRIRYLQNFASIMEQLRKEFPAVFWENCAAGAGRPDLAMDRWFARINRSDNQDSVDVLRIQEGFSYLHPVCMAGGGCQISRGKSVNGRELPLRFMACSAMMSWFSLGLNLSTLSREEADECAEYIRLYKKFRHLTDRGDLYRLVSFRETGTHAAFEFAASDASEAVLFLFGHNLSFNEPLPELRPEGLDPDASYWVERYFESPSRDPEPPVSPKSGRYLMNHGLRILLKGDADCRIYHLIRRDRKEGKDISFLLECDSIPCRFALDLVYETGTGYASGELSVNGHYLQPLPAEEGKPHRKQLRSLPFLPGENGICHVEIHSKGLFAAWTPQTILHPDPLPPECFRITSESGMEKTAEEDPDTHQLLLPEGENWIRTEIRSPENRTVLVEISVDYFWSLQCGEHTLFSGGGPVWPQRKRLRLPLSAGRNPLLLRHRSGSGGSNLYLAIANPGDLEISPAKTDSENLC